MIQNLKNSKLFYMWIIKYYKIRIIFYNLYVYIYTYRSSTSARIFDFLQLKMELNLQQRVYIKFCVKNGFNGVKILEMLGNCFGNDTLKKTAVYE